MLQANFPNKIAYGEGSLELLRKLDMKKVVIVADKVFCDYNKQVLEDMLHILDEKHVEHHLMFGEVGDPTLKFAKEHSQFLIEHEPDWIIAIGGGSVLDSTKVMEIYYEHPDITNAQILDRFNLPPVQRKAKLLAIPTTSGTGAEVSPIAVLYVPTDNPEIPLVKKGIADHQLIPSYVILDPRFTVTMPEKVTASTGLDAFVHCIEAYVNKNPKNIFTDGFALQGMKKVFEYLPKAMADPNDIEARAQMQIAATMGGIALAGRGSGASHGSGKQLATLVHLAHGISVAVPLAEVIRINSRKCLKEYVEIAKYVGVTGDSDEEFVNGLIAKWEELLGITKCPRTISDLGISQEQFTNSLDLIVKNAQNDPAMKGNPIPLTADEIKALYLALNK